MDAKASLSLFKHKNLRKQLCIINASELNEETQIDFVKIYEELHCAFSLIGFVINIEYVELVLELFENNIKF